MTKTTTSQPTEPSQAALDLQDERLISAQGLSGAVRAWLARLRTGDLGSLPIVAGLIVIWIIFQLLDPLFLSSDNLSNLATECAAVGTIAVGIVLVLLVGQIDLSVGSMSGVAASIIGVGLSRHGWSTPEAIAIPVLIGLAVGALYGFIFVRFAVPSFVITLAGLLALQGFQLQVLGPNGSVNIPFTSWIVRFSQQMFLSDAVSYVVAAALAVGFAASGILRIRRRHAAGLSARSPINVVVRSAALLVGLEVACWYLNRDRGISLPFVFFVGLVLLVHFMLTRTAWGRSVYAVGGNVEAARRAGIKVTRVYMSVFILCSGLAAVGGLISAGRLAAASTSSGGGDVNLNAIAAAVIGGTSLFGGRGNAYSALLGIVVIESIASGLTLLSLESSKRFIITGGVLMIAVIADSLSHRSRVAHGRA
jgi:D-xylose transport system permease protein